MFRWSHSTITQKKANIMTPYRSMTAKQCFCRSYPLGTRFYGWEESVIVEDEGFALDKWPQHTLACIAERVDHRTIEVLKFDRRAERPKCITCHGFGMLIDVSGTMCYPNTTCHNCFGLGHNPFSVWEWRWITQPYTTCFFLLHTWKTIYEKDGKTLKVCACSAQKTVHTSLAQWLDSQWMQTNITISNRFAAYKRKKNKTLSASVEEAKDKYHRIC